MSDRIALQGEQGCFSHLASLEIFPNAEIKFCSTFEETFQLAKENPKYKIVIPIENKLQVHAEHFLEVNHNLLGIKGSKIKDIETVRSHSQAIGQCQKIISDNNLKPIISADTAGSARFIFEKKDKSEAAIASALAAKIYNLEILKSNIEDESGNVTRFFIMGKDSKHPEPKEKKYITSIEFSRRKDYKVL